MEIKSNTYTDFNSVKSAMSEFYTWDTISSNLDLGYNDYIKNYSDNSGHVSIRLMPDSTKSKLLYIGISGTLENGTIEQALPISGRITSFYLRFVIGNNGLIIAAFDSNNLPAINTTPYFITGIVKAKDIITGDINFCGFIIDNTEKADLSIATQCIIGKNSKSVSRKDPFYYSNNNQLYEMGLPIINPYSATAIPEKILTRACYRNGFRNINGNFNFNGSTYYGVGTLIIPLDF